MHVSPAFSNEFQRSTRTKPTRVNLPKPAAAGPLLTYGKGPNADHAILGFRFTCHGDVSKH